MAIDVTIGGHDDSTNTIWNITEVIEQHAKHHPASLALILADRLISYRELIVGIHVIAHKLLDSGVRKGQTVGISMTQSPAHLMTLLAIARIGAIAAPVHPMLPTQRRYLAARRFGVSMMVSGRPEFQLKGIPFVLIGGVDLLTPVSPLPVNQTRRDDPCWIGLSSGTSGDPKGVLRSHGFVLDRIGKCAYTRTPQSRVIPMDLNFGIGFWHAMGMLMAGGAVVLPPDNAPANLAYMARAYAVTHWILSPAIAEDIAPLLVEDDIHFPSLTCLQIVGGAPSKRLLDVLFKRFTPNVLLVYATSEIGSVASATSDILRRAPNSAGRLLPWISAEVVDASDQPLGVGQSGQLRLKATGMFEHYYLDATMTAERFRDGWFYPRDQARIDEDGLLYIEGRQDDVANVGGSKIQFHDVEKVLQSHPAVREAAALVLTDQQDRELLAAAVITTQPVSLDDLRKWAEEQLGPICPNKLFEVEAFPRTATGKVLRDQLAVLLTSHPSITHNWLRVFPEDGIV